MNRPERIRPPLTQTLSLKGRGVSDSVASPPEGEAGALHVRRSLSFGEGGSCARRVRGVVVGLAAPAFALLLVCVTGCATPQERAAREQVRARAAKAAFEEITRDYNAAAPATGPGGDEFLRSTAARYERFLREYPDQPAWCAPALRSLGNVRAMQGRLDEAVQFYARVAVRYPRQEWEVLQAWKSAADLLWEAGRKDEARAFDRQIVARFDRPDAPPIYKTIVRAAVRRVNEAEKP